MSSNPYDSPQTSPGSSLPTRGSAAAAVRGPAIALIIASSVWLFVLAIAIPFDFWLLSRLGDHPDRLAAVQVRTAGSAGLLVFHLFALFGATQMLKLRRYGVAMATAILAVIPCFSACYVVGIPFGIWAIIVLVRPEVKMAFG